MSEQIFISYRREGGDIYAKAICDALKVRGYTVFYDFDSLRGGYFDERIFKAIEECNDFVLVLPPNALDRCENDNDWVRLEIRHAIKCERNIIPVMLPGFSFPKNLPDDIASISRINGIPFVMAYFDRAVIPEIIDRLNTSQGYPDEAQTDKVHLPTPVTVTPNSATVTAEASAKTIGITFTTKNTSKPSEQKSTAKESEGLEFTLCDGGVYSAKQWICTDTEITIPATYNGRPVTSIAYKAFDECSHITSVTIPNSVTKIGNDAFARCSSLKSVTIPDSVTGIGRKAFSQCSSLTSIAIPDSVAKIGDSAFHSCSSLTSISIPTNVKNIEKETFSYCTSLTSVTLPDKLMSIEDNAFQACSSLKAITIPNRVTSIKSNAFSGCTALTSITLPDSVKSIEGTAFWGCSSLTSIVIPYKVTHIGTRTFAWCSSLTSITLPSRITSIEKEAFDNCPNLNNIYFKGTVEQWKQIQLDKKWFPSAKAVVHCSDGNIKL